MTIKILGTDPGISSLGFGALELDIYNKKPFKLIYADTVLGVHNDFDIKIENKNQTKAKGLSRAYSYIFSYVDPTVVGCEDNFLGPNPASFKRLIELVSFFQILTFTNKQDVPFKLVLPRLAKQIVGADYAGSDKDSVHLGLEQCKFLDLNGYNLNKLTEHAKDGILVALYIAFQYYKDLGWDLTNEIIQINERAPGMEVR
jgi:Holliday junction resolvasome RuvABC endonuclease subunit